MKRPCLFAGGLACDAVFARQAQARSRKDDVLPCLHVRRLDTYLDQKCSLGHHGHGPVDCLHNVRQTVHLQEALRGAGFLATNTRRSSVGRNNATIRHERSGRGRAGGLKASDKLLMTMRRRGLGGGGKEKRSERKVEGLFESSLSHETARSLRLKRVFSLVSAPENDRVIASSPRRLAPQGRQRVLKPTRYTLQGCQRV